MNEQYTDSDLIRQVSECSLPQWMQSGLRVEKREQAATSAMSYNMYNITGDYAKDT
jgi:hypothetical protein